MGPEGAWRRGSYHAGRLTLSCPAPGLRAAILVLAPLLRHPMKLGPLALLVSSALQGCVFISDDAEQARLRAVRQEARPLVSRAAMAEARDAFDTMDRDVQGTRQRLMRLSETLLTRGQLTTANSVDRMRRQLESVDRGGSKGLLRRPSATLHALSGRLDLIKRRLRREGASHAVFASAHRRAP